MDGFAGRTFDMPSKSVCINIENTLINLEIKWTVIARVGGNVKTIKCTKFSCTLSDIGHHQQKQSVHSLWTAQTSITEAP